MSDDLTDFLALRGPVAGRPLMGLTVLVVEDSRFACEALRLLCLKSGARIRRADCLRSARRHLQSYRPSVVIVDLGLPDGSGTDLIGELTGVPAVLAISGDTSLRERALMAGAKGFLAKPVESLKVFQKAILDALPKGMIHVARSADVIDSVEPDKIALRDDLAHVQDLLSEATDDQALDYVAQFLSSIAQSAGDMALQDAAQLLARDHRQEVPHLSGLLHTRLKDGLVF